MATIVIFGATGDLAGRKLIPAIYNLWTGGFLPERIAVVGVARRDKPENEFRSDMCEALKKFSRTGHGDDDACTPFVSNIFYHALNFTSEDGYGGLAQRLADIEKQRGLPGHRLYYLATASEFFAHIIQCLGRGRMIHPDGDALRSRVVIEKPFGHDLASAQELNSQIRAVMAEDQIFRIDHYLGKETVQNILAFRFGNSIFEPLFNQKYVDHVQITVAETVGMEGRRGEFYDKTGALRDVVQNHALQLLSIVAMEPPATFNAKETRDEKLKVLNSVDLPDGPVGEWAVRGQYTEGPGIKGYLSEDGVAPDSTTETYAALRLYIDNWRWAGVPFLIRTGKQLKARMTEIAIQFKQPPTHYFKRLGVELPQANTLVFRIQPDEAISLSFSAKPPGMDFQLQPVDMDFNYGRTFQRELSEAYERLLLDALRGDSTLFMRSDEVESAWRIVSGVHEAWKDQGVELYRPGTWGPSAANNLIDTCEGKWRNP
ncbi:MAG: glucose-6-phosphate dehydrogenase [Candidatus Hydrogenedentes bacterium]|nr:glucose-6-phosphate dehydrogenase [Candidatus Hydrogenedentota bacterium]